MNVKKYLKQQAEQDKQKILNADGGEFLRELQQMVEEKPKKRPRLRVWLPATLSAVASAAVVVTCVVVYAPSGSEHTEYLDNNLISVDSTIEELNQDVKEVDLQIDPATYSYTIKKTSDSVSGDVLYYLVKIESVDTLIQMNIVTVCNPYYTYKDFSFSDATTEIKLDNYSVTYESSVNVDPEFGFETLEIQAHISKGKENIYILNYAELLLSSDGSFLEVLQSIVK